MRRFNGVEVERAAANVRAEKSSSRELEKVRDRNTSATQEEPMQAIAEKREERGMRGHRESSAEWKAASREKDSSTAIKRGASSRRRGVAAPSRRRRRKGMPQVSMGGTMERLGSAGENSHGIVRF